MNQKIYIPMLDLKREYEYMKPDIDAAIARCLGHQKWILGPEVKEFEDKVAEYLCVKHCIGTSSGTDALVLALRALAIKIKGEEYFDRSDLIITTPFTFTATGDAILRAGATPCFVDINPTTYNIDPSQVREFLTQTSKIKIHNSTQAVGILPVHLFGQSCQMDEIMSIADEYDLFVVEDCAQAFGAKWHMANGCWQTVGSIGDVGCFSFFPSKNLGGFGDAGAISTDDDEIADLVRVLIKHGGKDKYNVEHIGYNARIDSLQAAVLLAKLKYINDFNNRRRQIAQRYSESLLDTHDIVVPSTNICSPITNLTHVFNQFTLRVLNRNRDKLRLSLKQSGTDSAIYYPVPLNKMKVFDGRAKECNELSRSEQIVKEVLSLPIGPLMEDVEVKSVIDEIRHFRDCRSQFTKTQISRI